MLGLKNGFVRAIDWGWVSKELYPREKKRGLRLWKTLG